MSASHTLLSAIIDYAGLFPPAKLTLEKVVRNYRAYRAGPHAEFLGRLVLPIGQLDELVAAATTAAVPETELASWRLSVLGSGDHTADATRIQQFHQRTNGPRVVALETKSTEPAQIIDLGGRFAPSLEVWVELPPDPDPAPLLAALKQIGRGAKIRTGGTTPEAFPSRTAIARFLIECHRAGVVAKATAGLHHPITGTYPLTYEPGSPRGTMFGFMNVFLAAALARTATADQLAEILADPAPENFAATSDGFRWRHVRIDADHFNAARRSVLRSFGSCSFTEPIEGLQSLGWL